MDGVCSIGESRLRKFLRHVGLYVKVFPKRTDCLAGFASTRFQGKQKMNKR